MALIQTVDFFTPVVDDPYWFGQIAAANALSDIYAMGGEPKTALNLVAFPLKKMGIETLRQVIRGGMEKLTEADVVLIGGHSIEDDEMKYGLAVTGFVHPQKVLTKKNMMVGDRLVLTKPLGTGVINTAIKGDLATKEAIAKVTQLMATLNRAAAEIMKKYAVHACTDITGFGLLGHAAEMLEGAGCGIMFESKKIPILPEAFEYAAMGLMPAGAFKNKAFRLPMVEFACEVQSLTRDILFDPQTSGGLLICVAPQQAEDLVSDLVEQGITDADIIGQVIEEPKEKIVVR